MDHALTDWLDLAVPVEIMTQATATDHDRARYATTIAVDILTAHADTTQYLVPGHTGPTAAVLARALAALAYAPGGIDFAGRHWCTDHTLCDPAP